MCLAIVKPMGVHIPEEYLHTGWINNSDGAGFACITDEGTFLIHKSMTYEGFIDVYKDAIGKYGDISDFLIHFRITSKGSKTISNCHPFIVDDDRVIIHNGTMHNIGIDKDDTRSDTKVFAEDWLSQLPCNWEDNKIICLLLDDFIGFDKLCMLHRKKGIFIFNEDKGYWVDGIWYSNKSYEKHKLIPYKFPIKHNSNSEDEWDNWANWKSDSKGNKVYSETNNKEWVKCDVCDGYDEVAFVMTKQGKNNNQTWCYDCYKQSDICYSCGKRCNERELDEYYNPDVEELIILCDECEEIFHGHVIEMQAENKGVS